MELKPSQDKLGTRKKVKLDGVGNMLSDEEARNPFYTLARGMTPSTSNRRRRPMADTLGATPKRDGPFEAGATDVARMKPVKSRKRG